MQHSITTPKLLKSFSPSPPMNLKPFQIYLAMLIILSLIATTYIAYTASQGNELCILGGDCKSVQNSKYGQLLSIKVSNWGMVAFTLLFILYGWAHNSYKRYRFYFAATLLGALASFSFIAIQALVLQQWCSSCLVVDTLMLAIVFLSYLEFRKLKKYY